MKLLSETSERGRVIELTHKEWVEFAKLAGAVDGKSESETRWDFQMRDDDARIQDGSDFSGTFGAIRAFYAARFRTNEIKEMLESFQKFLENGK